MECCEKKLGTLRVNKYPIKRSKHSDHVIGVCTFVGTPAARPSRRRHTIQIASQSDEAKSDTSTEEYSQSDSDNDNEQHDSNEEKDSDLSTQAGDLVTSIHENASDQEEDLDAGSTEDHDSSGSQEYHDSRQENASDQEEDLDAESTDDREISSKESADTSCSEGSSQKEVDDVYDLSSMLKKHMTLTKYKKFKEIFPDFKGFSKQTTVPQELKVLAAIKFIMEK